MYNHTTALAEKYKRYQVKNSSYLLQIYTIQSPLAHLENENARKSKITSNI